MPSHYLFCSYFYDRHNNDFASMSPTKRTYMYVSARNTSVRVVNPFPVDLDARAEVNQQQDAVDSMILYFLFLFIAGILASGFYASKKITAIAR